MAAGRWRPPVPSGRFVKERRLNRHILLAEDTHFWRHRLTTLLTDMGHQVTAVDEGVAAIKACMNAQIPVDLVVVDLVIPGIDGFQVARYLRSQRETTNVPIVAVTGLFQQKDFPDGPEMQGFDAVIEKSASAEKFLEVFNRLLQGRRVSRRPSPRVRTTIPVTFTRLGRPDVRGVIMNLSTSGIFISTQTPLDEGTEISCTFALPEGASIRAVGLVIWVNGAPGERGLPRGMGLLFRGLPEAWTRTIKVFVEAEMARV